MTVTRWITLVAVCALAAACDAPQAPGHEAHGTDSHVAGETQQYTCPMHPHYISDDRNGSCPICGMDLVPARNSTPQTTGDGAVRVAPEMIQTMGVRLAAAEPVMLSRQIRAFGAVETNERREAVSVSRLEGWIDALAVTAEGDAVRSGQLLYRVYAPGLVAAQKDYLNALSVGNQKRIAAVRSRLVSMGVQESVIRQLTENRNILEKAPVYAEAGGIVSTLSIREGDYVRPGTPIMTIQSYADVWVIASLPEKELALIDANTPVSLQFPSAPTALGAGVVDYIYPTIDPRTRTAKVRVVVENENGALRPGAYADLVFSAGAGRRLAVPSEALLRDGGGEYVIAALGDGRFAPRRVIAGISANGLTEIRSGLAAGDQVVASGQFLLGSEANLREGFAKFTAPEAAGVSPQTPLSELPISGATLAELDHYTDMSLYFHEALIDGYKIDPYFVDPALAIGERLQKQFANTRLQPILSDASVALRAAKEAREGAALADALSQLTAALEPWLTRGAPVHYGNAGLLLFKDTQTGRFWLQENGAPRNPYSDLPGEAIEWPDPMAQTNILSPGDGER